MSNTRWSLGGPVLIRVENFMLSEVWSYPVPHTYSHSHIKWAFYTHMPHVPHTYFWMPLNIYMPHIHIEQLEYLWIKKKPALSSSWLGSALFLNKKNLAFLLTFYHETKMGKSLRYIYRYTFTQHTHTHTYGTKKLGGCIFITQFLVFHLHNDYLLTCLLFLYTLEWSVT